MDIGRAIRECAQERGMKQADICRATGLSNGYMSTLWRGLIDDPQIKKVRAIAHSFSMTVDDLLKRADSYED